MTRFVRFAMVGVLGAGLQLAMFFSFKKLGGINVAVATALAVEVAVLHNFVWHEQFTWPRRGRDTPAGRIRRLLKFHLSNGVFSILGNTFLNYVFIECLRAPSLLSAIGSIALCSAANFALTDRWVFKGQEPIL